MVFEQYNYFSKLPEVDPVFLNVTLWQQILYFNNLKNYRFHNFHHAFPSDYSASELGPLDVFNPATAAINLFAKLGLAWDLKKVDPKIVNQKIANTGNQSLAYKNTSTFCEWVYGLLTVFGPCFVIRLILQVSSASWKFAFLIC